MGLGAAVCVEVDSETEAVAGKRFKLNCIFCKMREEVEARASVEWYFRGAGENTFSLVSNPPPNLHLKASI